MSGWWLLWRRKRQDDLDEEIRAHLNMAKQDRIDRGEAPEHAEHSVRREFGNELLIKEVTRDMWGWAIFERAAQDLRFGLRVLKRSPGFTAIAVLTLALGIGANAGIFSVINSVLLRPMNYPQPSAIVELTRHGPGFDNPAVTPTKFDFWRTQNHVFLAVAAYNFLPTGINLSGHVDPERLTCLPVSADFFRVLGIDPLLGRTFTEAEDSPGAGHFVVISYELWKRRFNSNPKIIGQSITLGGGDYVVTGVMPAGFDFPQHAELWTPLQLKIEPTDLSNDYNVIARMKDGISLARAKADMQIVGQRFRERFGADMMDARESVGVIDYHDWVVGDVRRALLVLMGAVAFVLLLTCTNIANLLLARSASRQHEIAVRTALGASDWRLVRQLLAESLLLAVPGGTLGILFARASLPLLLRLAPPDLPMLHQVTMDWRVAEFAAALALASSLLFGLLPALQTLRFGVVGPLREAGTRTTTNAGANRTRKVLVISQVAMSLVLLVGAGLLIKTFAKLSGVSPGFDARDVLTMKMNLTLDTTEETARLTEHVVSRLESLPGVRAVANVTVLPLEPGPDLPFEIVGRPASQDNMPDEQMRAASPHYFSVMQIPVVAGRVFAERDTQRTPAVVIINEALARKYFAKRNPLGERLLIGRVMGPRFADVPREIIGVVGDTHEESLGSSPPPILFEPLAQVPDAITAMANRILALNWVIKTSDRSPELADQIRRETLAVSGSVPMGQPRPLEQVVGDSIARQRFSMTLLAVFAFVALLLAGIGLYGVISYSLAQRTREIGIRSALGADRRDLLVLVIGQGLKLAFAGLAAGLCIALGLTRYLESLLYEVTPSDPFVLASVTGILAGVALLASWLPANHASRIDPVRALREQ